MAIPVKETGNKVVVRGVLCGVCGAKLELNKFYHYIARDDRSAGLASVFTDTALYDAFDCPVCGCQYIAQERKCTLFDVIYSVEPSDDTETSDKTEKISDKEENPACKGCEHDEDQLGNPFSMTCVNCRRMYTDKYRKKQ